MSQLNAMHQAYWVRFKNNRRGYWSLWIVVLLFITSLFAELIANDKPLLVSYRNKIYLPVMMNYSETTFGGELATVTDYQDPFITQQIDQYGWAIWPPVRFSYNSINFSTTQPFPSPPSRYNLLGTNDHGSDVLANVIYGLRLSLLFGLTLTLISSTLGITIGAIQGYYGGHIDLWGQRFIEIWSGMPLLFIIILLSSIVQPGFWWLLFITVLFSWMGLVSVVRTAFLKIRHCDYVRAARAMGVNNRTIMVRHLLPHAMIAVLTVLPFTFCGAITLLAYLDFLGFGLPPGSPSLGMLLLQGKMNLQAPWLGITAFLTMAILLSLLIFIGEATRDACDPHRLY